MKAYVTQAEVATATDTTTADVSLALRGLKYVKDGYTRLYEVEAAKAALREHYQRKLADTQASMAAKVRHWEDRIRLIDELEGHGMDGRP